MELEFVPQVNTLQTCPLGLYILDFGCLTENNANGNLKSISYSHQCKVVPQFMSLYAIQITLLCHACHKVWGMDTI